MVAFSILFIAINSYVLVTRGQARLNETSNCAFYRCVGCRFCIVPSEMGSFESGLVGSIGLARRSEGESAIPEYFGG